MTNDEENQRIEDSARQKFESLAPGVKKQFGAAIDARNEGEAFNILHRAGFDYREAARYIMFIEQPST